MTEHPQTTEVDFRSHYGPWALITGGSEGVGAAWASAVAARGVNLILVARRPAVLEGKARELRRDYGVDVEVLSLDITSPDLIDRLRTVADDRDVGLVIHNVGSVDRDHGWFLDDPIEVGVKLIEVNCVVPTKLANAFLPAMKARQRGGFVVIGSLSCMAGQALEATYSAAKAFGQIFAEALWSELRGDNVHVVSILLGGTRTEALSAKGLLEGVDLPTSEEVVAEAIEHLGDGPVYVPVEDNRRFFEKVTKRSRRDAAETMARVAFKLLPSPTGQT